jgi:RNA-directed DNA polymerase
LQPPVLLTRRDVAQLLGVELKKLTWWVWALDERKRYRDFALVKRNGGTRTISAPIRPIKDIQRKLAAHLLSWYTPPIQVHGYVSGRGPTTNARAHRRQEWVLRVDLAEFFPTIHFGRVRGLFLAPPFDFGPDAATFLAQICCHNRSLPQGAPTSPVISNMICRSMDRQIAQLAARERCYFTRYADDITFSTDRTVFPNSLAYIEGTKTYVGAALRELITESGFSVNNAKTRLVPRSQRQQVTGLVINKQLNVPRDYVRELRMLLYIWEHYGLADAEASLAASDKHINRPPNLSSVDFREVMQGKVQYVGGIKGWHDPVYIALIDRLASLDNRFRGVRQKRGLSVAKPRSFSRELYVCTEGRTDVIHLRAAMLYFHSRNEYTDLELLFDEESAFNSDVSLAKHMQDLPANFPSIATVCLFDRDNINLLKKLKLLQGKYKDCGNGVAGVALAAPAFRTEPFCIELLYHDEHLRTLDGAGRRIYVKGEFNTRTGQHLTESCSVKNINSNQLIRDDVYEFESGRPLALTKKDFAHLIDARLSPFVFDFDGFRPTIELLRIVAHEIEGKARRSK